MDGNNEAKWPSSPMPRSIISNGLLIFNTSSGELQSDIKFISFALFIINFSNTNFSFESLCDLSTNLSSTKVTLTLDQFIGIEESSLNILIGLEPPLTTKVASS